MICESPDNLRLYHETHAITAMINASSFDIEIRS